MKTVVFKFFVLHQIFCHLFNNNVFTFPFKLLFIGIEKNETK